MLTHITPLRSNPGLVSSHLSPNVGSAVVGGSVEDGESAESWGRICGWRRGKRGGGGRCDADASADRRRELGTLANLLPGSRKDPFREICGLKVAMFPGTARAVREKTDDDEAVRLRRRAGALLDCGGTVEPTRPTQPLADATWPSLGRGTDANHERATVHRPSGGARCCVKGNISSTS